MRETRTNRKLADGWSPVVPPLFVSPYRSSRLPVSHIDYSQSLVKVIISLRMARVMFQLHGVTHGGTVYAHGVMDGSDARSSVLRRLTGRPEPGNGP